MRNEKFYFPVGWEKMTDEEQKQWARSYAELVLNAVEKKLGYLPPPPDKEEFHRLWDKIAQEKGLLDAKE